MKQDKLNEIIRQAEVRKLAITARKGKEYTRGSEDRLANFKRVAEGTGQTALQVWWVYFHKHLDALAAFIRYGEESSEEGIEGRIDDLQIYLDLGRGLVAEHKEARPEPQRCGSCRTAMVLLKGTNDGQHEIHGCPSCMGKESVPEREGA